MKNKIQYLIFLVFCSLCLKAQNELQEVKDFGSNPGNLRMFMFNPDSTGKSRTKVPLVIALHGCSQTAKSLAELSGWNDLAKRYGFIIIYPEQKFLNNPSSCFNWFNKNNVEKDKGEVFSIKQMVDYTCKTFSIDTTHIFVYGVSAGAVMGVALLADYPYMFNAGAILAGCPFLPGVNVLDELFQESKTANLPSRELGKIVRAENPDYIGSYPRLVIIHGENDELVNIKYSYRIIKQWASLVHTDTVPTKTEQEFQTNPDITRKTYNDSLNRQQIIFYDVNNLGHALMVFPGDSVYQGGHTGLFSINKHFFSTYWIAKDFGIIK